MRTRLLAVLAVVLMAAQSANAVTIIKLDLGGTGPDVALASGVLATTDDGLAGTTGDQDTAVLYEGLLSSLADIAAGASFTLDGVTAYGAPHIVAGTVVNQLTSGGSFSLYGTDNGLLLSGDLVDGVITGALGQAVGSFLTVTVGSFTGGSLFVGGLLEGYPDLELSLALAGISSGGGTGFSLVDQGEALADFTANATGQIDAIPEPASMALLLSGLLGGAAVRRKYA